MVFQKKRCKNTRIFRDNLQENGKSKRRKGRRWENSVQKGRVTAMSGSFGIRTDLAVESKEKYEKDNVEIKGVAIHEEYEESLDLNTTVVRIQTEQGARAMEKPRGTYITMEAPNLIVPDEDYHREISVALAHHLRELLHLEKEKSILVVGLGNREITPDALGPRVIQNLKITRHIVKEYGKAGMGKERVHQISSLVPGVMAQTGMETMEIIRGVIRETDPDAVIAIDALAARSVRRLNCTIQVTDTGINPGSGVCNHRCGLNEESLGIPSDTTNSEWPVQLTDVKPVMESLKTRYPWAAGAEDNVDMTPIIKENMTKLCSGAITADEFVSNLQAAGK